MSTFSHRLWHYFQNHPERVSIYLQEAGKDDFPLTYRKLYQRASAYAETFAQEGIEPGEVIVLIFDYSPDLLYAFWGAVLHGAIPSILPFLTEKLTPERYLSDLTTLISVTHPAAIVTYPDFENVVKKATDSETSVRAIIISDQIISTPKSAHSRYPGFERSPLDIVLLQHSSGTTGLQKGVALSHQSIFNQIQSLSTAIKLDPKRDVIVSWLPLYHDMGLIAGFLLPVLYGLPLVLMSPFDWAKAPYRLMKAVSDYQGTITWLPNFAYNFCARRARSRYLDGVDLSSWRSIINCSEPVRWESHQAFYESFKEYGLAPNALQTSYAMAENTFGVTQSELNQPPRVEKVDQEYFVKKRVARSAKEGKPFINIMSSGTPLNNTQVRVQNQDGQIVADRVIGEIAIQSDCMLSEYYHRPEITRKSLQDGWFLTGDYGYLSEGEIYVTGRKKDLIIVGGKNIYPRDLEELIYEIPGVHPGRAAVFGVFNEKLGTEDVVIIVESELIDVNDQIQLADEIRKHVTKNSPIALRFVEIVIPKWIVKTSSGKIARKANKEKYLAELSKI